MSRILIIKRMYCTPIGNYSFVRNITPKKNSKIVQSNNYNNNQTKNNLDANQNNKKTISLGDSYKGLWGFSVIQQRNK